MGATVRDDDLALLLPPTLVEALVGKVVDRLRVEGVLSESSRSPLLTADEAAELLRCDRRRVYRMAEDGRLERVKDGGRLLVTRASVEAHLGLR